MINDDVDDVLGEDEKPVKVSKTKKAKKADKPAKAKKAKKEDAKPAKKAKADKPAKAKKAKSDADELPTTQPEDKVVLAAVRKLKKPTPAVEISNGLGIHRRTIRAQLRRLAADKGNGFKMAKDGHTVMVVPR